MTMNGSAATAPTSPASASTPGHASWTTLYNYLTRTHTAPGPAARGAAIDDLLPGDIVQLSFDGARWAHTPVVVAVGSPRTPDNVFVAAHSEDADNRPLSDYDYADIRFLHVFHEFHGTMAQTTKSGGFRHGS